MKRMLFLTVLVLLMVATASIAFAQEDATALTFGEEVTGELAGDGTPVVYSIEVEEPNTILIIEIRETVEFSDMQYPYLILSDSTGTEIATASEYGYKENQLATTVSAAGTYTVTVTHSPEYDAAETVGEYALRVVKPEVLEPGVAVEGSMSTTTPVYYVVNSDTGSFEVSFERTAGQEFPQVYAGVIDNAEGEIISFAGIFGRVSEATFTVTGDSTISRYIVGVGYFESTFASYEVLTADFTLTVNAGE